MTSPPDPPGPYSPGGFPPGQQPPDGVPPGGYQVPGYPTYPSDPLGAPPTQDPLISADFNGWFSRATRIVKAGWRPLVILQAIGLGVGVLIQVPILVWTAVRTPALVDTDSDQPAVNVGEVFGVLGLGLVGAFVAILVAAVVVVASVRVGVSVAMGIQPQVGAALRSAVDRMFPMIGWQIVAGLIILAGVCACVLPAIYLYAVLLVLPAVVAFERTNAISRCFRLFHGDLGASVARVATIAGITIAASVLASGISSIVGAVTGVASGPFATPDPDSTVATGVVIVSTLLSTLITAVISGAAAVFTAQLTLTAYADMRARIEPVSTATLAAEIGLQQPAPPTY